MFGYDGLYCRFANQYIRTRYKLCSKIEYEYQWHDFSLMIKSKANKNKERFTSKLNLFKEVVFLFWDLSRKSPGLTAILGLFIFWLFPKKNGNTETRDFFVSNTLPQFLQFNHKKKVLIYINTFIIYLYRRILLLHHIHSDIK